MEPVIIGLSGLAGSGKDSVARILSEKGYQRLAFGDPIKDALYKLNPQIWDSGCPSFKNNLQHIVDHVGWDEAKHDPEVRRLLQVFGAEVGRDMFGEYVWVDKVFRRIKDKTKYVVTDCRYVNEADMVKSYGGVMWRIIRPGVDAMDHSSEKSMAAYKFDQEIINDGSMDELKIKVFGALRHPIPVSSE